MVKRNSVLDIRVAFWFYMKDDSNILSSFHFSANCLSSVELEWVEGTPSSVIYSCPGRVYPSEFKRICVAREQQAQCTMATVQTTNFSTAFDLRHAQDKRTVCFGPTAPPRTILNSVTYEKVDILGKVIIIHDLQFFPDCPKLSECHLHLGK
jgi:hypothetical protein